MGLGLAGFRVRQQFCPNGALGHNHLETSKSLSQVFWAIVAQWARTDQPWHHDRETCFRNPLGAAA